MSRLSRFILIFISILAVIVLGMVFHLRNDQKVVLDYFLGSVELYFSIVVVSSFVVGAVLGMLAGMPVIFKLKRKAGRLQRQIQVSEKEINNLRVMPLKDTH